MFGDLLDNDGDFNDGFADGVDAGKKAMVENFSDFLDNILEHEMFDVYKENFEQRKLLRESADVLRKYEKKYGAIAWRDYD